MSNQRRCASQGRSINWIIKLSKFCNLRCGYCYEWNELGDPRRMSAALVDRVLQAAKDLHRMRQETTPAVRTTLIIHGGEPLVLPLDYLRRFLDMACERFEGLSHDLALQSNLFRVTPAQIEIFREYNIKVGVSYDVEPGVRLTIDGRETAARVEENIRRVREAGLSLAGIVVIGKHTAPRLRGVYDRFADLGMMLRVLPLADGPAERPIDSFLVSLDDTVAAMCDLFDYWFETGLRVAIDPFRAYVQDAIRFLLGVPVQKFDRAVAGDYAFFVNVDGRLYAERDAYEVALSLGDLNTQAMANVLRSDVYRASLAREAGLILGKCPSCALNASCAGWPIVSTKSRGQFDDACAIAPPVILHIVKRLEQWGYGREALQRLRLEDGASSQLVGA